MTATAASQPLPFRAARARRIGSNAIDGSFLATATGIGLIGFHSAYGSYWFLLGGGVGLAVGIAIAAFTQRLGLPAAAAGGIACLAFFALGGAVALRTGSIRGALPLPVTIRALGGASIHGWRDLLTLPPPVGNSGPLLVIPYLLAMAAGVSGYLLATKTRSPLLPTLAPMAVLVASILFGAPVASSLTIQGAGSAAVLLAWGSVRSHRRTSIMSRGGRRRWRVALAAGLLAAAVVAAHTVGPHLPYIHSHQRVVLRNYVQPPFDPTEYPSPLAAFRKYVVPHAHARQILMVVKGLPRGVRMRFATMDTYDGYAWGVTNGGSGTAGDFQRIGSRLAAPVAGRTVQVSVLLKNYTDVWLPDVGYTEQIRFGGPRAGDLRRGFRYNLVTGTGVVLSQIEPGDEYTLTATVPASPDRSVLAGAAPAGSPIAFPGVPPKLASVAKAWAHASSTATYAQLRTIAEHMRAGAYSDGATGAGAVSRPGHGERRLTDFLDGTQLVGDDEQYAATFALFANALGFPARVVIGAVPERDGVVRGRDVHAWDEVQLAGGAWLSVSPTPPKNRHPTPNPPKFLDVDRTPTRVPPPTPAQPPAPHSIADTSNANGSKRRHRHRTAASAGFGLAAAMLRAGGPPAALAGLLAAAIVAVKGSRRRRRRTKGSAAARVSAGWKELVDLAIDLGAARPAPGTRRDVARHLPPQLGRLAARADEIVFGPLDPNIDVARGYWASVDETRARMLRSVGRTRRFRAAISLRSLGLARPPVMPRPGKPAQAT